MEDTDFFRAEEHDSDHHADDEDGELSADLRECDGREAEQRTDDVHEEHCLTLREPEVEQAVVQMPLVRH